MGSVKHAKEWERFWFLITTWQHKKWEDWKRYDECICNCWNIKYILRNSLRTWATQSCWCLHKKVLLSKITKHWFAYTRFYKTFLRIESRCNNKNATWYKNYWWRWIKNLWDSFEDFKNDMYDSYLKHVEEFWEKDTTIDRIDVNWNYCKENCRRATIKQQSNNKRTTIKINIKWKDMSLKEICNNWLCKISYDAYWSRRKRWWKLYWLIYDY